MRGMPELRLVPAEPARVALRAELARLAGPWLDLERATEAAMARLDGPEGADEARVRRVAREQATAALVEAARVEGAGGRAALERLLDLWQADVHRWCRLLGGPALTVEDAAHDTLLAVLTGLGGLADPRRFRAWLWGLTWRTVRGHRRRAWLRRWLPGVRMENTASSTDTQLEYELAERSAATLAVLDALPLDQRELLWLAYAEGLTRAELAEQLGLAPGTLNRRLTRARRAFEAAALARGLVAGERAALPGALEVEP